MRNPEKPNDAIDLDRLVDGELTDAEYRRVLEQLEQQPDGWRQCALAFLEAQAWKRELRGIQQEDRQEDRAAPSSVLAAAPAPRRSPVPFGVLAAACAASFLLAFGIAWQMQSVPPPIGEPIVSNRPLLDRGVDASSGRDLVPAVPESAVADTLAPNEPLPVGRYQFVVDGNHGTPQTVEMPVFAAGDPRAARLIEEDAHLARDLVQSLRQQGHQVERQRNWLPMQAESGAPLYVPVDELRIVPVANRSVQ